LHNFACVLAVEKIKCSLAKFKEKIGRDSEINSKQNVIAGDSQMNEFKIHLVLKNGKQIVLYGSDFE
jgi:hypothetical protein